MLKQPVFYKDKLFFLTKATIKVSSGPGVGTRDTRV